VQEPAESEREGVARLTRPHGHDIVVIGASAGGIEALSQIVELLPEDLPAAVLVTVHLAPDAHSALPAILGRKGLLPAVELEDGMPLGQGRLYVAPPNRHLLIDDGHIRLSRGPRENGHRPAIDPLFRSAARTYGARVVAVILSGNLGDGTLGLKSVHAHGGVAIVQDPDDALHPSMPTHAIASDEPDYVLPASEIAAVITHLALEPAAGRQRPDGNGASDSYEDGDIAEISCPECGGPIWEIPQGEGSRYLCRTGHSFTAESLFTTQSEGLESALWTAIRVLQERRDLAIRIAERLEARGAELAARRFRMNADDTTQHEDVLRRVVENVDALADTTVDDSRAEAAAE